MVLSWIGVRTRAKTEKKQNSIIASPSTFVLEPILTPSAGIDGGDSAPDIAIIQSDTQFNLLVDLPDNDIWHDRSSHGNHFEVYHSDHDYHSDIEHTTTNMFITPGIPEILPFPVPSSDFMFQNGVFTVGDSGELSIDFLFDGSGYQGELAVFSLHGLEGSNLSVEEFIRQAAERALSNSELGHIVISDITDGAKFSAELPWEGNFNSGDYQGVRSFQMRAGDRVGFMLVPNGRVEDVLNCPMDGAVRPLFSMAPASEDCLNPGHPFYMQQLVDVTGDGSTFAFEDSPVDAGSDRDYNDIIFQVRGARGEAIRLDQVIDPGRDWRTTDIGQALIHYTNAYIQPGLDSSLPVAPRENQPLIGVIDTGFAANNPDIDYSRLILGSDFVAGNNNPLLQPGEDNEHGTHILGIIGATRDNGIGIDGLNDQAPIWVSRAIGSGQWANSLTEFVDTARASGQPNAVVNLSFDLTQINRDGSITTRYELTPQEWAALEYARQNNILVVVAAGNDGGVMSALGQASQEFDNIITVGSSDGYNRAEYSSYGYGLDILAAGNHAVSTVGEGVGSLTGTSVATAKVTGAASQVWAANPQLSYRQVIDILKSTARDLGATGFDLETGAGLLNLAAAISIAKVTKPEDYLTPAIGMLEAWSDASLRIPTERAAADAFMGKYYEWDLYTVRPGDTLSEIALRTMGSGLAPYYNFIASKNGIANPNLIYVNQTIFIPREVPAPPVDPPVRTTRYRPYIIKPGDTLWAIAQRYLNNGNRWREISKDLAGTQFFTEAEARLLQVNQTVYLPVIGETGSGRPVIPSPINTTPQPVTWQNPLPGYPVTSGYGLRGSEFHYGIDIGAPQGTPIRAAMNGTVVFAGWNNQGYGNLVILEHSNGTRTYYAHMSTISVSPGMSIAGGSIIGQVGSTGNSTGPHLHFEIRVVPYRWPTDNQNPRNYIQF